MGKWTPEQEQNLIKTWPDLRWFDTAHLPDRVAAVVLPFRDLAFDVAGAPAAHGSQVGLTIQRLIEAKDAAVRARVLAEQIIERNKNAGV